MKLPSRQTVLIVALVLVVSMAIAAIIVWATYPITSNEQSGTVNPQPTPTPTPTPTPATMSLTLQPSTITVGQTWTLTATLSDGYQGLTVTFRENQNAVGTAVTNSNGVATLTLTPTVGSHTYDAICTHP